MSINRPMSSMDWLLELMNLAERLNNLESAYFISSKREAVCLHFTFTHNWPTLNFRPISSQQSRWYSFVSVNLLHVTLHYSLQYSWFLTILKWKHLYIHSYLAACQQLWIQYQQDPFLPTVLSQCLNILQNVSTDYSLIEFTLPF